MKENCVFPYEQYKGNQFLIFLAGPIIGAPNWQQEAINIIHRKAPEIIIASPKHPDQNQTNFTLEQQADWESFHLEKASKNGSIMFWLAREIQHRCDRPYAQTSRFELGEWMTKQKYNEKIFLTVGVEDGFTNSNYIKRRFSQNCPNVSFSNNLEQTCNFAIDICKP